MPDLASGPSLQGRSVLITGAAGGIGAATARRLAAAGAGWCWPISTAARWRSSPPSWAPPRWPPTSPVRPTSREWWTSAYRRWGRARRALQQCGRHPGAAPAGDHRGGVGSRARREPPRGLLRPAGGGAPDGGPDAHARLRAAREAHPDCLHRRLPRRQSHGRPLRRLQGRRGESHAHRGAGPCAPAHHLELHLPGRGGYRDVRSRSIASGGRSKASRRARPGSAALPGSRSAARRRRTMWRG